MSIKRRSIFIGLIGALSWVTSGAKKPDVLFIAIDDMNNWTTLFDKSNQGVIEAHKQWLPKHEAPFTAKGRQDWVYGPW